MAHSRIQLSHGTYLIRVHQLKKKRLNLKSDALEHFDIRRNTNGIKIIVLIKNVVLNVIFKCFGIKYWKEGSECFIFKHLKDQVVN
jgi:hypothetical protein